MTAAELAEKLGVTKQAISSWERGVKEIPQERLEELSRIFASGQDDIIEIKNYIIELDQDKFQQKQKDRLSAYADFIGSKSFEKEYKARKKAQKELEREIHKSFEGPADTSLYKQIDYINRGMMLYRDFLKVIKTINSKPSNEQMAYFCVAMETLAGVQKMMGEDTGKDGFMNELAGDLDHDNVNAISKLLSDQVNAKKNEGGNAYSVEV